MQIKPIKNSFSRILLFVIAIHIIPYSATPGFDTLVAYDTAWTFAFDGGLREDGSVANDVFRDVVVLKDGSSVFVGQSGGKMVLIKLNAAGKVVWQKVYKEIAEQAIGTSIIQTKNGDFVTGGSRWGCPWVQRLDSLGAIKWEAWLMDTANISPQILSRVAGINSLRETKRGTFICAAGDNFTDKNYIFGNIKYDYAAMLSFDSTGKLINFGEAYDVAGYSAGGFCIEETAKEDVLLSGNQTIFSVDSGFGLKWKKKYTFQLDGVGAEVNNIVRCKQLRDGSLMVAGMAYEGNCWTKFKKLYYDAWWSPLTSSGTNTNWDTAGYQGGDDAIHDFTQLTNGNLVFIGSRYVGTSVGGIWIFVTDSTGKKLLWEKQTPIKYLTDAGKTARGYVVRATEDGGFTIGGEWQLNDALGGGNALAVHFKPIDLSKISDKNLLQRKSSNTNVMLKKSILVVHWKNKFPAPQITVFNAAGRMVTMKLTCSGTSNELVWDFSTLSRGIYFYSLKTGKTVFTGRLVTGM